MPKIVTVIGARPQFIKASVVSRSLRELGACEIVVHTGQHHDGNMSDIFFSELGMTEPAYHLGIHGGTHGAMTGRMITAIESVLLDEQPHMLLVYGDTNSTLAGALAAAKLHIPIAHVEAGLRSGNMRMPEEINRIVTDRLSTWLFVPTSAAAVNLEREGIAADSVLRVGDVMFDVAVEHGRRSASQVDIGQLFGMTPGGYALVTVHRAENTDDRARLRAIVNAVIGLAARFPVIWPLHPRTRAALHKEGLLDDLRAAVDLVDPVSYLTMVALETGAALIITDSGGVQKEAYFHRVPCVTVRDETEWVELVDTGWNRLAPPDNPEDLLTAFVAALGSRGSEQELYGDGTAALRIAEHLVGTP